MNIIIVFALHLNQLSIKCESYPKSSIIDVLKKSAIDHTLVMTYKMIWQLTLLLGCYNTLISSDNIATRQLPSFIFFLLTKCNQTTESRDEMLLL